MYITNHIYILQTIYITYIYILHIYILHIYHTHIYIYITYIYVYYMYIYIYTHISDIHIYIYIIVFVDVVWYFKNHFKVFEFNSVWLRFDCILVAWGWMAQARGLWIQPPCCCPLRWCWTTWGRWKRPDAWRLPWRPSVRAKPLRNHADGGSGCEEASYEFKDLRLSKMIEEVWRRWQNLISETFEGESQLWSCVAEGQSSR